MPRASWLRIFHFLREEGFLYVWVKVKSADVGEGDLEEGGKKERKRGARSGVIHAAVLLGFV